MTPGAGSARRAREIVPRGVARPSATSELPDATPCFLEACAKLAVEALARGDRAVAETLLTKAARVAGYAMLR